MSFQTGRACTRVAYATRRRAVLNCAAKGSSSSWTSLLAPVPCGSRLLAATFQCGSERSEASTLRTPQNAGSAHAYGGALTVVVARNTRKQHWWSPDFPHLPLAQGM